LYGPLIVRKPDDSETQKHFYDQDLASHVLVVGSKTYLRLIKSSDYII